ncbi:MAG: trehalose-phosphatase [Polyangiaceae bacterium]|nr:trehalose-phosphatase [Polyangiaceae bacterium]
MKRILAANNCDVLAQFAWAQALIAFDFDGTLAPIVEDRDRAFMRPRTRMLLERVVDLYPTAIISGRSCADVVARLDGVPVKHIVGNHGLEPAGSMDAFEREVSAMVPVLHALLDHEQGVDIENKRYSLAIHYRRARRKKDVRAVIFAAIAQLQTPPRVTLGKLVINVIPANAPHKGDALVRLRDQERADVALYVGDDVTDEDVFELDQPGRLLCIRVGNSRKSAAPWYLRDQQEMDLLLEKLVELRARGRTA